MAPQTEEEPDDGSGEGRPAHFGRRRESPCAAPTGAHSATTSPCREGPRALPLAPPSARPSRVAPATPPWPITRLLRGPAPSRRTTFPMSLST